MQLDDSTIARQMIANYENGNLDELEKICKRYDAELLQFIGRRFDPRLNSRFDVTDVLQEVRMDVIRSLPKYVASRPMPLRMWILKTAHQVLLTIYRRHIGASKRSIDKELALPDSSSIQILESLTQGGPDPCFQLERAQLVTQIREVISSMTPLDREIIMLRTLDELNNAEAAMVLDISTETSRKRFARALTRLRKLLDERGLLSHHD